MTAAKHDKKEIEDNISLSLKNFESMLSTHLQGRYSLSERAEFYNCTRHEFMLSCGITFWDIPVPTRPAYVSFPSSV
jgi:hypothetical protein